MVYERCQECGHIWHGLFCEVLKYNVTVAGKVLNTYCNCPPQFTENVNASQGSSSLQ